MCLPILLLFRFFFMQRSESNASLLWSFSVSCRYSEANDVKLVERLWIIAEVHHFVTDVQNQ